MALPQPMSSTRLTRGHGAVDGPEVPSNHLWVGNLSAETNDADLTDLFIKYGALDSVTTYSSRSFAFVYFKRVEDATAAKDALQGSSLRGNPLKIEFARPAKPCKHLWVGGISPTVTKDELEEEFLKFGKIEDFKFLRDRNTAFVEYFKLEDASQALKNMNGKQIGGEQIRVDFLRSQPSRRDQWPNSHDSRDGQFLGRGSGLLDIHSAYKRPHPQPSAARKGDGQPSKILWIGYPPSVQVDEQMLHNAMILFGEIERIKSFPSRNYSFVEFRSVDEARRAKEGLQGRLFNDPRITIMYSSSDLAPGKDYPVSYLGVKGPSPEMILGNHPLRYSQMDMLGHNHQMMQNNFSGLQSGGVHGPNMSMRSFGGHGNFEHDIHGMQETNLKGLEPNWRRLSPSPGMRNSPVSGIRQPMRHVSDSWDVSDVSQFQRDPKRSRIDNSLSIDDASFPSRRIDDFGLGFEQPYGLGPITGGGASTTFMNVQGMSRLSPMGAKVTVGADNDCIWRGIIAKGGTPVCHARCVPIGKGIGSELPEVVNCSARTGLDMLAKHYAEAIGFEIVFFLPDSEENFASYTEFLRYLGSKNRAGVAKFDDGTTLFLVPPSDFLTKVLKVVGPERLYGVVLKLPHQSMQPSEIVERQNIPPLHAEHTMTRLNEEQVLPMDYGRFSHDDPKIPSKPQLMHASESQLVQPSSLDHGSKNTAAISQAGVSLTPELIATLASLVPGTAQSAESALPTTGSSTIRPILPDLAGHSVEQLGQFSHQAQPSQIHNYASLSSHSAQMPHGSSQYQELTVNMPQPGAVSSRPMTNFAVAHQSAHIAVSPAVSQQNQFAVPPSTQKGYGVVHGTDASTLYGSPVFQQPNNPTGASNLVNISQTPNVMSLPADKVNSEYPNQMQQLQSVLSGAGQGASEDEVDKNQRYQSTLQFAANLLLQIQNQQQQQQPNTVAGRGTGNQL
ncbi:flowering time control protein FPA [Mangifera indica]|uniref:flowering time control protein FPA n=1 Tax=Mangifera indica TaxID=29780 RepID=UPI001CFC3523|nr:flowering time control protein FPA [Mangifera indica]XP_044499264.1 flowering time control protein FPA [Mangifera indica]XP_044499265.1 flowering time control protein FPA [Mangifera indica]XP_044499266.1 flowering time control protein FPA [Mangifera indica]